MPTTNTLLIIGAVIFGLILLMLIFVLGQFFKL